MGTEPLELRCCAGGLMLQSRRHNSSIKQAEQDDTGGQQLLLPQKTKWLGVYKLHKFVRYGNS